MVIHTFPTILIIFYSKIKCPVPLNLISPNTLDNSNIYLFFFFFLGKPEGQKDAEIRHKEIAASVGGSNDFLMLLCVFEKCRAR